MIHNRCYDRRVRPSRQFKASKGGQVIGDTQARWSSDEPNSYARVFGYDEEGRLVKIERDYGSGGVQLAYEYGYNSDGARVWKRDVLNEQEYRYVCRIGCGGVPMRVYNRAMNGESWASVEDYLRTPTVIAYTHVEGTFGHYVWLSGHWLADWTAGGGWMYYQDQFGVEVDTVYIPAGLLKPGPEYLRQDDGVLSSDQCGGYLPTYALFLQTTQQDPNPPKPAPNPPKPAPKKDPFQECLDACTEMGEDLMKDCNQEYIDCLNSTMPSICYTLLLCCKEVLHTLRGSQTRVQPPPRSGGALRKSGYRCNRATRCICYAFQRLEMHFLVVLHLATLSSINLFQSPLLKRKTNGIRVWIQVLSNMTRATTICARSIPNCPSPRNPSSNKPNLR
jgi:hypothetical protein